MPNTEEEEFLLGVLPHGYFYQFSQYKIHKHSGDEIKFIFETRVNGCAKKNVNLFLSTSMSWGISHPGQTDLLIFFWNYTFQSLGILFLFPYIAVPTPKHGNEIPRSLCQNLISTSLHGNKIPTKCLGNEIPTNHLSELYTIYNPASWWWYVGGVGCEQS